MARTSVFPLESKEWTYAHPLTPSELPETLAPLSFLLGAINRLHLRLRLIDTHTTSHMTNFLTSIVTVQLIQVYAKYQNEEQTNTGKLAIADDRNSPFRQNRSQPKRAFKCRGCKYRGHIVFLYLPVFLVPFNLPRIALCWILLSFLPQITRVLKSGLASMYSVIF